METVGELLRKERLQQGKSLLQVERATNLPQKTLVAIEKDDFSSLPGKPFAKGFIKIYAKYLGLDSEKLVAVFRRDWKREEEREVIPKGLVQRWQEKIINPKTALITGVFIISALFFTYIGIQVNNYLSAPNLEVYQPKDGAVISQDQVVVEGKTQPGNTVYINDQLINVSEDGSFNYTLKLFSGKKEIIVRAVNRQKRETVISRSVEVVDN